MSNVTDTSNEKFAEINKKILEDLHNANSALIQAKAYLRNTPNRGLTADYLEDVNATLKDLVQVSENLERSIHNRLNVEKVESAIRLREASERATD